MKGVLLLLFVWAVFGTPVGQPNQTPPTELVRYPKGYERPAFHRTGGKPVIPTLIHDLEQAGVDNQTISHVESAFHQNEKFDQTLAKVLAEADRLYLGNRQFEEAREEQSIRTQEEEIESMKKQIDSKIEELVQKQAIAMSLVNNYMEAGTKAVHEAALVAKQEAPQLFDEFVEAELREESFWKQIVRALADKFRDSINQEKFLFRRFKDQVAKHKAGSRQGQKLKASVHEAKTVRRFLEVCTNEGSPITDQLARMFPSGKTMPLSAHPFCWCEGRLQSAYEQRTGFIDYFYNNFAAMRTCLNSMCEICHLSFGAIWMDLKSDLNPEELCLTFSKTDKPLLMSQEEAFDQCKRMARGFAMNAYGVNTKTADLLGGVEAFRKIGDCEKELEAMKSKIGTVAEEVCLQMDCCKTGHVRTPEEIESFQAGLADTVQPANPNQNQNSQSSETLDESSTSSERPPPKFSDRNS